MPSTVLSPKSCCTVHTQRLEFIVTLSDKMEPCYQSSALDSVPYSHLSQQNCHRGLDILWQTVKSSGQVIHNLFESLHSAQFSYRKAAAQCAHKGLSLLWLPAKKIAARLSAISSGLYTLFN